MTVPLVLPDGAASRAVLIGVHAYEHLDDLPAVSANLTALRDLFTDPALCGLPDQVGQRQLDDLAG